MKNTNNKTKYRTAQRESLYAFFKSRPSECFSAAQIIKSGVFDMGEATVYRLLSKLAADGELKRFTGEKGATYQYSTTANHDAHFHMTCLNCGETMCVDCGVMADMERHIKQKHAFAIDNTRSVLYGICERCGSW